jgi:hypothetical protein
MAIPRKDNADGSGVIRPEPFVGNEGVSETLVAYAYCSSEEIGEPG